MKSAASAGIVVGSDGGAEVGSTIAFAAARLPARVVWLVMLGWVPYAATKLISDSGCLMFWPKSAQLVYGASCPSLVRSSKPSVMKSSRPTGITRGRTRGNRP